MSGTIFDDSFDVKDIDRDGKKFERVSRIFCTSDTYDTEMILDVNVEIYPIEINNKLHMALVSTLNLDGSLDEGVFDPSMWSNKQSYLQKYEYVMHGRVFKQQEDHQKVYNNNAVYVSFGGLLMMLKGDPRHFRDIELDQRLYLLVRKSHY